MRIQTHVFQILPDELANKQPIVLFDGECSLCSSSVRFLLRHNRNSNLNFASLQSAAGMKLLILAGKAYQQNDTLILIQDDMLYGYSTAALKIAAHLEFPWRLLVLLKRVPVLARDSVYKYIAQNRLAWFSRKSFCVQDTKGFQERFLS